MKKRFIKVVTCISLLFFYGWVIFCCINIIWWVFSCCYWWTFEFSSCCAYYKKECCCKWFHVSSPGVYIILFLLCVCVEVELLHHIVTVSLIIWGKAKIFWKTGIQSHQCCGKVSVFPLPCQHLLLFDYFYYSCSSGDAMLSLWFSFAFPQSEYCWAPLH